MKFLTKSPLVGPALRARQVALVLVPEAALVADSGAEVRAVAPEVRVLPVGRAVHAVADQVGLRHTLHALPSVQQAAGGVFQPPVGWAEVVDYLQRALHNRISISKIPSANCLGSAVLSARAAGPHHIEMPGRVSSVVPVHDISHNSRSEFRDKVQADNIPAYFLKGEPNTASAGNNSSSRGI